MAVSLPNCPIHASQWRPTNLPPSHPPTVVPDESLHVPSHLQVLRVRHACTHARTHGRTLTLTTTQVEEKAHVCVVVVVVVVPCEMMVDSSATTGWRRSRAALTSSDTAS